MEQTPSPFASWHEMLSLEQMRELAEAGEREEAVRQARMALDKLKKVPAELQAAAQEAATTTARADFQELLADIRQQIAELETFIVTNS